MRHVPTCRTTRPFILVLVRLRQLAGGLSCGCKRPREGDPAPTILREKPAKEACLQVTMGPGVFVERHLCKLVMSDLTDRVDIFDFCERRGNK